MEQKYVSHKGNDLRIGILDDDPCALAHETGLVKRMQNLNGCHLNLWTTTNPELAVHNCLFATVPTDIFIVDLDTESRSNGKILRPVKAATPNTIIIGITSHIEEHRQSQYGTALNVICDKASLDRTLPAMIEALYRKKMRRKYRASVVQDAGHPFSENTPPAHLAAIQANGTNAPPNDVNYDARATSKTVRNDPKPGNHHSCSPHDPRLQEPTDDDQSSNANTSQTTHTLHSLPAVPLTPMEQQVLTLSLEMTPRQVARTSDHHPEYRLLAPIRHPK
ncbi:hypothetical protein BBOH_1591 [Bifidobacterium bohemicum DSM 22767]|uniref:Uncharacterized protein n=1 Tax=Bifidobacterium bohemicum DSM 22767 TaxID=1437606 RepID=A0A086ZEB0_9BIFI|nr:response regulator [Bifidobacterium bohemicum]KFI44860.1 hypothetical protein BBOH_1591 [Bifidobacterium bohemicum DSM 22767]